MRTAKGTRIHLQSSAAQPRALFRTAVRFTRTLCTRGSRSTSFTGSPALRAGALGSPPHRGLPPVRPWRSPRPSPRLVDSSARAPGTRTRSNSIRSVPWAWRRSFLSPITTTLRLPCRCRRSELLETIPISVEWTVPFRNTFFHLGVHNLPPRRARSTMDQLKAFTERPLESELRAILAGLHAEPGTLTVFNHPLWDEMGIGPEQHRIAAVALLSQYGEYLHAIELNGLRPWRENSAAIRLARDWAKPVISGGDRHVIEPNATRESHRRGRLCGIRQRDSQRMERRSPRIALPDLARHARVSECTRRLSDLRESSARLDALAGSRLLYSARWNEPLRCLSSGEIVLRSRRECSLGSCAWQVSRRCGMPCARRP